MKTQERVEGQRGRWASVPRQRWSCGKEAAGQRCRDLCGCRWRPGGPSRPGVCPQLGGLWKDLGLQTLVQTGGLGCESRGAGLGQVDRKLAQWSGAWRLRHAGDSQICGKPLAPSVSLFICEMETSSLNLQAVPEGDAIRKGGGQGSHSRSLAGVSISWTRSQLRAPGPATCVQVCTVPTRPTRPQTAPHISDPTLAQALRGVGAHSREGVVTLGWWGGCHGKGQ